MTIRLSDPADLGELLGIPFTAEQTAAITAPLAPQVIVAGAGSGKTTVMAARVVWLVATGQVSPGAVLGLTFTNKAAGELSDRVRRALERVGALDAVGGGAPGRAPAGTPAGAGTPGATGAVGPGSEGAEDVPGEPEISTYHAFAGRLLSEHGLRVGVEPASRLLTDASRFQLAAEVLRAAPASFAPPTGNSTGRPRRFAALVEDLVALDGELAEHLVEPERLAAHDERLLAELADIPLTNAALRRVPEAARGRLQLLELVRAYRARKRDRDLLDFGDQIALSALLARDAPEVGRMLREQYAVILLDEYQDTSVAQRVLLASLFGASDPDRGADRSTDQGTAPGTAPSDPAVGHAVGHAVTAVGDPCQAIYGWRGASVANLDDFPRHFPQRDGTPAARYTLTENRRSGGRLLALANDLAAPLRARHPGVAPLRPADDATGAGRVRCALLPDRDAEHRWLAESLAHLVRTGTPPGGIAVLCRTAADFAALQDALTGEGLPTEVVGLSGLLHLPEVADLVAVCRVLADPTANASLVRLLTGPRWRIGPRDLALLGRRARLLAAPAAPEATGDADRLAAAVADTDPAEVVSLADALDTFTGVEVEEPEDGLPFSTEARVRFAYLATELRELRRAVSDPLMDILHRVLSVTGLEVELSASPQALAARRRETLHAFLGVAAEFAAGGHRTAVDRDATLPSFLAYLDTAEEHDNALDGSLPSTEDSVKILTAHKAKGLEWDVVALPGLHREDFPQARSQDSWLRHSHALPTPLRGDAATLPALEAISGPALRDHDTAAAEHREREELRLGYVAVTRPRTLLLGSGHRWGPTRKRPRQPSPYLEALRAHCAATPDNGEVEHWAPAPASDEVNPLLADGARREQPWPLPLDPVAAARRREAAERVLAALAQHGSVDESPQGGDAGVPAPRGGAAAAGRAAEAGPVRGGSRAATDADHGLWEPRTEPEPDLASDPASDLELGPDVDLDLEPDLGLDPEPPSDREGSAEPDDGHRPEATPGRDATAWELTPEERRTIASWDRDVETLTAELRRSRERVREVSLPASLSATQLQWLAADPAGFARELARPMPRRPQPAARRGTRFHAWVESRFEELALPLLGPDELPGADPEAEPSEIRDERDLAALKEAFERTPYARRTPYQVEAPFQIRLAGRTIRGRIDAVYRDAAAGDGFEIIDWKTGRTHHADPLQLAVYRLAWAERHGLPLTRVAAAFLYVRTGAVVRPTALPDRAGLERILRGEASWPPEPPG